jgi:hypothetical protein
LHPSWRRCYLPRIAARSRQPMVVNAAMGKVSARRLVALSAAACMLFIACQGDAEPGSNDSTPQAGFTPGEAAAQAPVDPDGLADTVATTTAAMLANGDQTTAERYAADVRERTGCNVEPSSVAYADNPRNRLIERRQRNELIEQLLERPTVTAVGHARRPVGRELPSTIGRGDQADLVGVVVALSCA